MVWLDGQDLEDWWQGNLGHRYVGEPLWTGADWRYLSPMSMSPKGGHCRGSYNQVDKILCSVAIRELLYTAATVPALWMPMKRPCSRDRGCGPNRTPSVKAELANASAEGLFCKCQWLIWWEMNFARREYKCCQKELVEISYEFPYYVKCFDISSCFIFKLVMILYFISKHTLYILLGSTQFFLRFGVAWVLVVNPLALPLVSIS